MKKNGFTLIELIVCFALVTVLSMSIFKTVLSMQQNQVKNISYNSYLSFVSVMNNTIQNDFLNDTISNVSSCNTNCYDITYVNKGVVRLQVDRINNTITYDGETEELPTGYKLYKDISLLNFSTITTSNYDSYYLLRIPIKGDLFPNMEDIKYTHLYSSDENNLPKHILHLDLDGGTIENLNENILYGEGSIISLPIPTKKGYIFTRYEKISGNGTLSGNTFTMSNNNVVLKAIWELTFIAYSDLVTDYHCSNNTVGSSPYIFEYGGACEIIDDGNNNWKIRLLGDTTTHYGTHNLTINENVGKVDVFLVGGGGGGGGANWNMGGGGGGGYVYTKTDIEINPDTYEIIIGNGGNARARGGTTSAFEYTAEGGYGGVTNGKGGNGGSGGGGPGDAANISTGGSYGSNGQNGDYIGGTGSHETTCEFGLSISGAIDDLTGCAPGVDAYSGGGGGSREYYVSAGGVGGGGGYNVAGTPNTGGGGGSYSGGDGKIGGSGIVIIRNKRN